MKWIITDNHAINLKQINRLERFIDSEGNIAVGLLYKNGSSDFINGEDALLIWNKIRVMKFKLGRKHKKKIRTVYIDRPEEKETNAETA